MPGLLQALSDGGIEFSLGSSGAGRWHFTIFDPSAVTPIHGRRRRSPPVVTHGGFRDAAAALIHLKLNALMLFPDSAFAKARAWLG